MSDIVDRLNTLSDIIMMGEKIAWEIDSAIMRDAAAEIEKLRVKIAKAEKKAERDYLRFVDADREEITRLREENARLREALRYYAEGNYNGYNGSGAFARAAIREGGKIKAEAACPKPDEAP